MKPDSYAWVTLLLAKPLSLHMKKQKQLFHKFTKTCFIDNMYTFYFHLFFLLQASVKFLFFITSIAIIIQFFPLNMRFNPFYTMTFTLFLYISVQCRLQVHFCLY